MVINVLKNTLFCPYKELFNNLIKYLYLRQNDKKMTKEEKKKKKWEKKAFFERKKIGNFVVQTIFLAQYMNIIIK